MKSPWHPINLSALASSSQPIQPVPLSASSEIHLLFDCSTLAITPSSIQFAMYEQSDRYTSSPTTPGRGDRNAPRTSTHTISTKPASLTNLRPSPSSGYGNFLRNYGCEKTGASAAEHTTSTITHLSSSLGTGRPVSLRSGSKLGQMAERLITSAILT